MKQPGFQVLVDDAPHEVVVGAIGKVWQLEIPFVHVADADAFAAFSVPGFVKVAWALRVSPRAGQTRTSSWRLRVDATDDAAWPKFRRYFGLIGPASRFIRRSLLRSLARELGRSAEHGNARRLAGDESARRRRPAHPPIDIAATPETIWPWLVQMGRGRAGFYSVDVLDNDGARSAREVHPELQRLAVGDMIPATPVDGDDGFEVLRRGAPSPARPGRVVRRRQAPFDAARPHASGTSPGHSFSSRSTRAPRASTCACVPRSPRTSGGTPRGSGPVHRLMQRAQLRHLAAR